MIFDLFVPNGDTLQGILPGSAIVGSRARDYLATDGVLLGADDVVIDYEGARYKQTTMRTLADKATHAAGRHMEHYPTVARRVVSRQLLIRVGTFYLREERIEVEDSEALAGWLGTEDFDSELYGTSVRAVKP